jgi:hypothetical protein
MHPAQSHCISNLLILLESFERSYLIACREQRGNETPIHMSDWLEILHNQVPVNF